MVRVQKLLPLMGSPRLKGWTNVNCFRLQEIIWLPNLYWIPNPIKVGYEGFTPEANAVMTEGKKLWQVYFAYTNVHTVRDELKLNRPDVDWCQIRKAMQAA